MMNQNGSCGCNRRCGRSDGERINVGGGCGNNGRGRCGCVNTCRPKPCPHPCRPKPCPPRPSCEKRCEERAREMYRCAQERAREVYRRGVEDAREEYRCCMRNCRRDGYRDFDNYDFEDNGRHNEGCGCSQHEHHEDGCGCGRYDDLDDDEYHCCSCNNWNDDCSDVNDQLFQNQPVGMAYVPQQCWSRPMGREEGFAKGTIFQDLYKPFKGECK